MVNCELVRLDADKKPLEAIYPVIEYHQVPEMIGEVDYDGKPLNRLECGYFSLLRARIIALWAAEEITATHLGEMLSAVAESNLGSTPFSDESETEANDETVIEMFNSLKDVNLYLQNCDIDWVGPFSEINGYADEVACKQFSAYLLNAVVTMRTEAVRMLSDEQLNHYEEIADFLRESPHGVGLN